MLVTPLNFERAESDLYFSNIVGDDGFGHFFHIRELSPIDHQLVIRTNRDTLYSGAVFDLDAGPVTITLPDTGGRFMSLQIIDEDHYVPAVHYGGQATLTREDIGTRYVATAVRTLVDPNDPADIAAVHALQDSIVVAQDSPGVFDVPAWDQASQKTVRDALITLAATLPSTRGMFGTRDATDPVLHLLGSAYAWGGNPDADAMYLNVVPARNDGATVHRLVVGDVPVDGFWSVTVYDKNGYFTPNDADAYSFNNVTATAAGDGTTVIQFGGGASDAANYLPITAGWNYMVRLYRPRPEVLDGSWSFPVAEPI